MALAGKKIVIGITGGIAAYKINILVRLLVKNGAEVRVIVTPSAETFVSKNTLSVLSKNTVYTDFYSQESYWNNHVELALWADVMLIAPCTANTLAKMTHGLCDNFLLATYLSAKCPVVVAPAMDLDMYKHPTTRQNLEKLKRFGHTIIDAEEGELASGLYGTGRMAEPETIFRTLEEGFTEESSSLAGKTVLITAGPTYEAIDPVRFIGNHSSGKMGFALAEEAAKKGGNVVLISGVTTLDVHHANITLHRVVSAQEMYDKVFEYYHEVDIAIASAAVADYTPRVKAPEKIKKNEEVFTLELIKNPDILLEMGQRKENQFLVGFALETENEEENARAKLKKKNLDMIVLNSLKDEGAGFQGDTNRVSIFSKEERIQFPLKSKTAVAKDILHAIETRLSK